MANLKHRVLQKMTVKFYLSKPNEESGLFMRYRHRGLVYQYGLLLKASPETWDAKRMRFKDRLKFNSTPHNLYLDRIERAISEAHMHLIEKDELNKTNLKEEFLIRAGAKKSETEYFTDFVEMFIEEREASGLYKPGSITVYRTVLKKLKDYESFKRTSLTFDNIDMNFYYGFLSFLKSKKFKTNYLNKIFSNIKSMMASALDRGYHSNVKFTSRHFSVPKEEVFNIYLDEAELHLLFKLDLRTKPGHERTRDLFIVAAYTGLRYSDVSKLDRSQLSEDKIHVKAAKGGKQLVIPCHPVVRMILKKYDYNLPRGVANQSMNVHLKTICEEAKIISPVMKEGKSYKKFQLVSTHTARRSFATNAFKAGIPSIAIMKITGHSTEQSFMKYIKITAEENADLMAQNPFFKAIRKA